MSSNQRKALSEILELIDIWRTEGVMEHWQYSQLFDIADNAPSEPLKNCEVGTVEEQTERFRKFCFAHMHKNGTDFRCHNNCPAKNYIGGWGIPYCQVRWGQLPYESEVKNG
jgi:hypothetical protein